MRTTYITALVIAVVVILWLISGQIDQPDDVMQPSLAVQKSQQEAEQNDGQLSRVRATVVYAQPRTAEVTVRGQTQNKRTVIVRSETRGRVISRPVERGEKVAKGDLLCQLATDDREAAIVEASAGLTAAKIDFDGSVKLQKRGLQSETAVASINAKLATAKAKLTRAKLELARTQIRAPFGGLIEETFVESGDFIQSGTSCVTLVDLSPMLLVGQVAERNVHRLKLNSAASGLLSNGQEVQGRITFVGSKSNEKTRTYAIEVEIPNADYAIKSGFTAKINIGVEEVLAQLVSPALLSLDDEGKIGIRTVNSRNRVVFNLVEIIADGPEGIWITGIPEVATLITVGQELVVPGEEVDVVFEDSRAMPASINTAESKRSGTVTATDAFTKSVNATGAASSITP